MVYCVYGVFCVYRQPELFIWLTTLPLLHLLKDQNWSLQVQGLQVPLF